MKHCFVNMQKIIPVKAFGRPMAASEIRVKKSIINGSFVFTGQQAYPFVANVSDVFPAEKSSR